MDYDLVVIGGGGAGVASACEALKYSPSSSVLLISEEEHIAYPRCDLPYLLFDGKLPSDAGYSRIKNLEILRGKKATDIDVKNRKVACGREEFEFDSLVIATGSRVFIPPIRGVESKGVVSFRTIEDFIKLKNLLESSDNVVIVGAGAIGLELAEVLVKKDYKITVVEMFNQILPKSLDKDMSKIVERTLIENGVNLRLGDRVEKILADKKGVKKVKLGKDEIKAEIVILATGVRPNVELAAKANIKIGKTGGIKTDERMETNKKNIFAAGDCAENVHFITREPFLGLLGSSAYKQGKVAGINAVGGDMKYDGIINPLILKIFDIEIGAVGLTEEQAKQKFDCISAKVRGDEKALFNDGFTIAKLIASRDGRILGCQLLGSRIPHKIDMLAVAMRKGMNVYELMLHETSYSPILTQQLPAITLASEILWKKLSKHR